MRRLTVVFTAAVAAALLAISAAFACDGVATLDLSVTEAHPGDLLTVTGHSYTVNGSAPLPVVIRWNGADGRELARAIPDASGAISASFRVPDGQPGYYVVVAVQRNATGADAYGTPSRASLKVLPGPTNVPLGLAVKSASHNERKPGDPPPYGLLGGALLVGAAGTAVVARRVRANRVPPPRPLS